MGEGGLQPGSNAFKFTLEEQIAVSLTRQSDRIRFTDTGTGVPREELPRIFERFHRVEGASGLVKPVELDALRQLIVEFAKQPET